MLALLGVLLLTVCASAFAGLRDGSWEVNPAAFRYDMSLYFKLVDEDFENLEKYEIGAFVEDECRGLAEKLDLPEDRSCLFMRIRSNKAEGENIDFWLRNRETGDTVVIKAKDGSDFTFKSDGRVGFPSDPYIMERFFSVSVNTEGKGQVDFTDGLYAAGSVIDLKAIPEEGYHFEKWSDGSEDELISLILDRNIDVTATFAPNIYKAVFKIGDEVVTELEVPCDAAIEAPEAPAKVGYTFDGWADIPETMPAGDIEILGSYTINTYKLVFKADGKVVEEAMVEYDAPISAPADMEKEGYTFSGWGELPERMPAHDVEMHSYYTINSYLLTFILDDETVFSEEVVYGSAIIAPEAPVREGYTFDGWSELPATMPAKELTITGDYSVNYYKITYKIDGEVLQTDSIAYGEEVVPAVAPDKTGYTFNGWGDMPEVMPAHDLEMHSTYTLNYYRLSFTLDGEELEVDSLIYGASIVAPEVKEKIGHTFSGWGEVPAIMPAEDLAFSGEYIVNKYNLTYKIDGEVAYHAEVDYNTAVPRFNPDPAEGKTFSGWGVIPDLMPARDLEFNGSFISNVYMLTFRIGGKIISYDRMPYGAEITAPEAPAREGYSFTGWQDVPATMPAKDLLIDGDYEINKYKVTYLVEDKEYLTQEYEFGAPIKVPAEPTEEGHSFSGWGDVPATMPAYDLTFGGTFAENFYRVTFRLDGAVFYTDDFEFGAPITAPEAPAKEGYTFNGWGEIPAAMPAYNLEYDGSYTVNSYEVTFKIGDEVIYSGTLAYGAEITAPEAPAKEGYSFGGWGIVPFTMPASDLLITGEYSLNSYTLTYRIGEEDFLTTQLPYGAEITAPEAPAKEGNTFSGWSSVPATMPANDLVITGAYAVNNYMLTFKIGEDVIFTGEIPYGMEISAPEAPAKEGHSFTGWGMVPATMPAFDLEVLGAYEVNLYTLTYSIDGVDFYSTKIAYGSEITAPEAPVKEGHTFLGWRDAVTTMPAGDLVISGTYSVNSYNVSFKIADEVIFEGTLPYGSEIVVPEAPVKDGYTFAGWGMVPATMPASDLEFTGAYDVNIYTLTFDIDGEVFFTTQLAYGTEITAPAEVPDKEGNTFVGWGDVPATMPANDLVISGTYSVNNYTLTFKIGEEIIFTGQQPFGSEIVVPVVPEKDGYSFSGWGDVPATVPDENLEFTGEYVPNEYTLTFKVDGEVLASDKVAYGAPVTVPEVPEKEGHTFAGFGVVPATMPASDLEISGVYDKNYYSVTFKAGEVVVATAQVAYGDPIIAPAAPVIEGHTFNAWTDLVEGMTMPARDLVFEAAYDVDSYTLTFRIGDYTVSSEKVAYGSEIVAPEAPAKEGHTFTGWGMVPATMPASDLEITGVYEVNFYNVVFRIGEEVIETLQVAYGSEIAQPTAPEKEGYEFAGWGDVPATMPASDLEFNGSYDVKSYNVTFRIDGEDIATSLVEYGAEIVVPEAPELTGHTFAGWGIVPATMPASDLVFTGAYEVNSYSLIFKINDDIVYSAMVPYGTEIVAPEAPVYEGCSFSGWSEYPATMPAEDVTVTGTFSANIYKAVFTVDGEVVATLEVPFNGEVVAPEAPDKEGYTFVGWIDVPETMPAHDIEIEGAYEVNHYRLVVYLNDEVYMDEELPYGAEIVIPAPDVEDGMRFDGWQEEIPSTMPAHDVEIHGTVSVDPTVGVAGISADTEVTVITLDGAVLYKNIKVSDIKERLTPGIYIINGEKKVVR